MNRSATDTLRFKFTRHLNAACFRYSFVQIMNYLYDDRRARNVIKKALFNCKI